MISKNRIKYLTSLKQKKFRTKYNQFLVEGDKIVKELLIRQDSRIIELIATEDWLESKRSMISHEMEVSVCSSREIKQISGMVTAPEVLALLEIETAEFPDLGSGRFLYLDRIQDPGNLGTIWRICDWFGMSGILCSSGTVDPYNPKVIQSSMGAFLRIPVFSNVEYSSLVGPGMNLYAADMNGEQVNHVKWPDHFVLVMGNESRGLHDVMKVDDAFRKVCIPSGAGAGAESLNVASACGIILYEAVINKKS